MQLQGLYRAKFILGQLDPDCIWFRCALSILYMYVNSKRYSSGNEDLDDYHVSQRITMLIIAN